LDLKIQGRNYFEAHKIGSNKLLNDESKKEMQKTQWKSQNNYYKTEYGLGLEIDYIDKRRVIGHGGGFPGHITKSYYDPQDDLAVVLLTNAMSSDAEYKARSIIKLIDYFQKNYKYKNSKHQKLPGRYMGLWSQVDIISLGDKLAVGFPNSWEPFIEPDELKEITAHSFKICKTSSFAPLGETVEFNLNEKNTVDFISYAGEKLIPESIYNTKIKSIRKIEQL
jgi:D-alanyl-D-alanine carboxypeptidase